LLVAIALVAFSGYQIAKAVAPGHPPWVEDWSPMDDAGEQPRSGDTSGPAEPPGDPGSADAAPGGGDKVMPPLIFWLEFAYLLILGVVFYAYHHSADFRDDFPSVGPFPIGVLWFGALGGVMVGMSGIFFHNRRWDDGYNYWHISRPFMGAAAGGVGALLFYVVILLGNKEAPHPDHLTFEGAAFIFGFGDDAFRAMIKKVTDLLIAPATAPPDSPGGDPHQPPAGRPQAS
jgi:hypothetical protein